MIWGQVFSLKYTRDTSHEQSESELRMKLRNITLLASLAILNLKKAIILYHGGRDNNCVRGMKHVYYATENMGCLILIDSRDSELRPKGKEVRSNNSPFPE